MENRVCGVARLAIAIRVDFMFGSPKKRTLIDPQSDLLGFKPLLFSYQTRIILLVRSV